MAILGRGISGLPLSTDSLIVGVGGILDELPVGTLNQVLTVTGIGVDWADASAGTVTGGTNLTVGDGRIFSSLNGNNLEFRALVAGPGITITENVNDVTIESTAGASVTSVNGDIGPAVVLDIVDINDVVFASPPANSDVLTFNSTSSQWEAQAAPGATGGESNTASNIGAGIGVFDNKVSQDLQFRSIIGTNGITATLNVNVIEIDGTSINGTVTSIGIVDSSGNQDLLISGSPITTSGNINIELAIIPAVAGTYTTPANVTVDNKGRITAIAESGVSTTQDLYETFAADTGFTTANTPTDTLTIAGGVGIVSTATPDTVTLNLEDSGVIAGTFVLPTVTVDLQGRVTSISNGTALQNIVEDGTPQLGGNLDVQGSKITTSTVNGNIVIEPNGIGLVIAQTGYDMSSGPDEAFASKLYVDTATAGAGVQNLFESVTGDSGTITAASATDTFKIAGAPASGVTTSVSGNQILIDFTNAALFNVVEDLTPQLGGNLDVQTFALTTSTLNGDIAFTPNGTGIITGPFGYDVTGEADEVLVNKGYVDSQIGGFSTDLEGLSDTNVAGKATDDLLVFTGTTWDPLSDITLNTLKLKDHGANGQTWVIEEDAGATNALTFDYNLTERARISNAGDLTITGGIVVPGTTTFNTVEYTWPGSDGTAGQVLKTDGAGNLSFSTVSGGAGTQNLWETISGNTGSTTADSIIDILTIAGGTGITTVATDNTLTITNDISSIDDLSDVDVTTSAPTTDDTLVWNGVNFIPTTLRTISIIAGALGTPFTAASLADTFNIVGDGVSLDTSVTGDTLTISNSADNLGGLTDVDLSAPAPSSGEALVFNGAVWKPQAIGGAQNLWLNIDADTGIATANATGDTLFLTGGTGITTSIVGDVVTFDNDVVNLGSLSDVSAAGPSSSNVLTWTGAQWEPQAPASAPNLWATFNADTGTTSADVAADALTVSGGTNITTAIVGDVLTINNDLSTLGSLTNVNILVDTATANDVLAFVGGEWIAQASPASQNLFETIVADVGTTTANTITDTLTINGGTGISTSITGDTLTINAVVQVIDDLNDVDTTTVAPTVNQVLKWNLTNWVPADDIGAPQNLYETVIGDTGSTTASTITDSLTIVGAASSGISVAVTDDTVTIDANLTSGQITVPSIGSATFTTDEDTTNVLLSGGWVTGGAITDNGNGTVAVATGSAVIRATDSSVAQIVFTDWIAVASQTLTDQTNNFIYVEYNAGTPQIIVTVSERTDFNTNILLGTVYRDGIVAHINTTKKHVVSDHANQAILRFKETLPFQRASGAALSETGTRNIAVSTGVFWEGLTRFTTAAFDSSTADTFSYWFTDGIGGWNEVGAQSQINNTQYDNAGTLTSLASNNFGTHYIYLATDSEIDVIYGTGTFTLQEAMDDAAPGNLPPRLVGHSRLVGKIIIQLNATTFEQVVSAFIEGIDVSAAGLFNVVEDTTPQLGGNLDVNGNALVSTANADIAITPNGTGAIDLGSMIHEKKNTTAVTASQTAVFEVYASTFDATYLDYVFQTAGGTRVGTLILATDGTTVGVADTGTDIGTVSISFTAVINTTNVDVSFTENLAAAGTLTYTARRMTV